MILLKLFVSLTFVGVTLAHPQFSSNYTASCTITDYSQVSSVLNSCTNIVIGNLNVPSLNTLYLNLKDGSTLTLRGTITFEYGDWKTSEWLMTIQGKKINVIGESGHLIYGNGEKYWDGQGGNGGRIKPKLLHLYMISGTISKLSLKNCPMFCTIINGGTDLTIDGWTVDNTAGDPNYIAKNTDGIGIAESKNVQIKNAYIHNQDQCIYVNQGSNMVFSDIHCVNSNGISAQAGFSATDYDENTTKNITFHNVVMEGGLYGLQVLALSSPGGPGQISDITFQNIILKGPRSKGIYMQMDYGNAGHPNNNMVIRNIKLSYITGTVATGAQAVEIYCGKTCSNWLFSNVNIQGATKPNSCNFQPQGFNC